MGKQQYAGWRRQHTMCTLCNKLHNAQNLSSSTQYTQHGADIKWKCTVYVMQQISTRRAAYIVEQAVHSMLYTLSRNSAAAAAGTQKSRCTEWGWGAGGLGAGGLGGWGLGALGPMGRCSPRGYHKLRILVRKAMAAAGRSGTTSPRFQSGHGLASGYGLESGHGLT